MFDIGFLELIIIAVVGLVVIGPERLPGVARNVGKWVGRTRRFVTQVKSDIDREMKQEDLRQALERDAGLDELKQIMNSERFSIEEEDKPDYMVKASSDDEPEQTEDPSNRTDKTDNNDTPPPADTLTDEQQKP
ncbi:MAG: Sec-independent protein translocase protein TatB [Thiohalophilus sp.]|uniref:Sec-independent protein translocase protein TatB n=1 Tax=Thiohalophilus sp. TaxID=3028392 RepID=UPI00287051C4|nr:Sec-independent protein translocase protein TatB [Thiohalophilus sp.]MDR9436529.1 Sec-independent protein translocase protein TatB [Thiohalophilus sp.]